MRAQNGAGRRCRVRVAAAGLACGLIAGATAGCGPDAGSSITVLAAASLTDTFPTVADRLRAQHPDADVRFSFAGSSALAEQIRSGAPADVIATASTETMASVADLVESPRTFARNAIVVAVPRGNPAGVAGLADLARPGLRVVLCAERVPCGAAAAEAFRRAGVTARPDSAEPDVRAVLTKVQLGEADAGVVYRTDARAADDVEAIEVPVDQRVTTDYQVAVVKGSANRDLAEAFVAETTSGPVRQTLAEAGFVVP